MGGLLLFLTGTSGAVWVVRVGWQVLATLAPRLAEVVKPLFVLALLVALLGGLSVMLGGWFLARGYRFGARVLLTLGIGTGFLGLLLQAISHVATGGGLLGAALGVVLTLQGIGLLLANYARLAA